MWPPTAGAATGGTSALPAEEREVEEVDDRENERAKIS
jgi:hypothetical protein